MDFGLGLVLSFTDNATAGINNAVNSLNNLTETAERASTSLNEMASLSALSVVSNQIGSAFTRAGNSILGVFSSLLGGVKNTGSEFESFRITLEALYGDAEKAEMAISKLLDFSIKSPFEVEGVKDMLIVLQSQGVDAFNNITGSITGAKQETLSWIADLMAFKPDEATSRWKRALTNYIGSGEDRMLRNILDMGDIADILGHEIGSTVDERLNDIIQIVESKNLQGLSQNLATTWQGVMSNMSDAYTKLYKSIADNGVFEQLKNSLMSVSGAILQLDNEQIEALGKTVADGLNRIIAPITYITEKANALLMFVIDLCQTNPELIKFAMVSLAIAGALFTLIGMFFKMSSALASMNILILTFGKSFTKISGLMKTGSLRILSSLLPLTATLGMMYFAWKNDLGGLRTDVTYFVNNLINAFKTAYNSVNGSVTDLIKTVFELNKRDDFFSNLTLGIMKVMGLFQILADAWDDNTISGELYRKMQELGLEPLVNSILDFKYRFEAFKEGFIDGWKQIGDNVSSFFDGLKEKAKGTFLEDMLNSLTAFFQKLSSGDPQAWYKFGESFASITANIIGLVVALKSINAVLGVFSKIFTVFSALGKIGGFVGGIGRVFSKSLPYIAGFISKLGEIIYILPAFSGMIARGRGIHDAFVYVLGGAKTLFLGLTAVITGIVMAVTNFIEMFKNGFNMVKEILMVVGIALAAIGAIILGAPALIAGVIAGIVAAIATAVIVIKDHWSSITTFFSELWNNIVSMILKISATVADAVGSVVNKAINGILKFAVNMIDGFIDSINFAIGLINAIPGVNISPLQHLDVPQLAEGGIVSKPTMSIIGEAGTEAVMPLENNTAWIGKLAQMITSEMGSITPTNSRSTSSSNNQGSSTPYLTSSNTTSQVYHGNTDNSVVFNQGAIQVTVQNATEEEAIRLAKMVMAYIKRQQELDKMVRYA